MGRILVCALILLALAACAGDPGGITLRPQPADFERSDLAQTLASAPPPEGTLYATLRRPAGEDESARFYADDRGPAVRVGRARLTFGDGGYDWAGIVALTLDDERDPTLRIDIDRIEEDGILTSTLHRFTPTAIVREAEEHDADAAFARSIDARLTDAGRRDVVVYVHGYRVGFEQPVLIAAEFAHYLGYRQPVIAFSWPSTQSRWAYVSDIDTADVSTVFFRRLLAFIEAETGAERIHIVGYSAGTRLVARALADLALQAGAGGDVPAIGNVILTGSDLDRALLAGYLEDGLLDAVDRLTIYSSGTDRALGLSEMLFFRQRLGQTLADDLAPAAEAFLRSEPRIELIDVTGLEGTTVGNGHAYFRDSPRVATDVLTLLSRDAPARERGLVRQPDSPIWTIPPDASGVEPHPQRSTAPSG